MKKEIEVAVSQIYPFDQSHKFTRQMIEDVLKYDFDYVSIEYCESANSETLVLYIKRIENDAEYQDRLKQEAKVKEFKKITDQFHIQQAIDTLKELKPEVLK